MSILLRKTKESMKNQKAGTAKYTNIGYIPVIIQTTYFEVHSWYKEWDRIAHIPYANDTVSNKW
jgi:hypothetical protein